LLLSKTNFTRNPAIAGKSRLYCLHLKPASDLNSWRESDLSVVTQIHACYVNTVAKATINASITDIARGHFARWYK